jgi:multiple sugar transport system permease protein
MATNAATPTRGPILPVARIREALVGYGFVLLPMGFFALFFIWPIVYAIYISRYDWGVLGKLNSVGWQNYTNLVHDDLFRRALRNTILYTAVVVPAQMALGLLLALAVNQKIRGRGFFRSAYYFPAIASSAAITAIFIYLLNADGLLNSIIGGHRAWLGDPATALWAVMGLNVWTTSATVMLFYLAALQSIPTDVYEASAIDGASRWRTFSKITFPLLKPGHFFVAVVSIVGCLKVFDQPYIVSGGTGGPAYSTLTVVLYLYQTAFTDIQFGYAAAMGVALFAVILTLTVIQRLLFGKAEVGY